MSAPHFFLGSVEPGTLRIEGEDARHAVRVLRIAAGETITVSDGAGRVATARVAEAGSALVADVVERRDVAPPAPRVAVYQALPKAGKLDGIVQTLTQIGVDEIVPVRARRSVARWDEEKAQAQHRRLTAIAREAAMQSRRAFLPVVGRVDRLDRVPPDALVLHEEATLRLGDALPSGVPGAVALVVGPEGGFDADEVASMTARGCRAATLGPTVLRTEVAPLVAAALVLARYGRLG